jgi:hypothetical protein
LINIKVAPSMRCNIQDMKAILRLVLLICLLPGLVTGILPLPGQAMGMEMVICADGAEHVIRVGMDGQPVEDEADCALCCVACGPAPALLSDTMALPHPALHALGLSVSARPALLPERTALFPAPRGPPLAQV